MDNGVGPGEEPFLMNRSHSRISTGLINGDFVSRQTVLSAREDYSITRMYPIITGKKP
jgi:hypothetical protein